MPNLQIQLLIDSASCSLGPNCGPCEICNKNDKESHKHQNTSYYSHHKVSIGKYYNVG